MAKLTKILSVDIGNIKLHSNKQISPGLGYMLSKESM